MTPNTEVRDSFDWIKERVKIQIGDKTAHIKTQSRRIEYRKLGSVFQQVLIIHIRLFDETGGFLSESTTEENGKLFRIAALDEFADLIYGEHRLIQMRE